MINECTPIVLFLKKKLQKKSDRESWMTYNGRNLRMWYYSQRKGGEGGTIAIQWSSNQLSSNMTKFHTYVRAGSVGKTYVY